MAENGNGTCRAPTGQAVITPLGYQVAGKAVCLPPESPVITYQIKTCEPQLFVDCRKTVWFKDVYKGNWKYCRAGQAGWVSSDLDMCPTLFPILVDPCTYNLYYIENNVVWSKIYTDGTWGNWVQYCSSLPRTLAHLFMNTDTGVPFYFPTCLSESDMREVLLANPFCSTGYQ